ncbi:hypothetical protein AD998_17960 [bacterium 336/3]|jgi:hypothetical protein|nr:hypothetical protein AD998_17960 [bacterium 336/3]
MFKKYIVLALFALFLWGCAEKEKKKDSDIQSNTKIPLKEDTTKRKDTSEVVEQNTPLSSFNGVYFCPETKELYYLEGDENSIKKVFYTKAKSRFSEQKIVEQKKIPMESTPLDPDYLLTTTREHKFGVYPSGQRYFVRKDSDTELVFFKLTEKLSFFDTDLKSNIILAEALSQNYLEENNKADKSISINQLEMRYSLGFKYKNNDIIAIVKEDFSIETTVPEGKILIKDGMGAINLEVRFKDKPSFMLVQKIK